MTSEQDATATWVKPGLVKISKLADADGGAIYCAAETGPCDASGPSGAV
jgi:hypothetical protein